MALIEHRQRVKFLRFPPIALLRLAGPDRFPAVLAFFEAGVGHPRPACTQTLLMAEVARAAPVRFLGTAFEPDDWAAIFLKSYDTNRVAQRVGSVSWVQSESFQRWLRAMNSRKYSVFVSVNAITSGRRSRTREAIGAIRHVFLDADDNGTAVLSRVEARRDLPPLSYVL